MRRVMLRIAISSTALLVSVAGLVGIGGAAAYADTLIQIDNTGSHKCVTVVGTGLYQLPCTNVTGQNWIFLGSPGGVRQIENLDTGLCMLITNFSNGAPVVMSSCASGDQGLFWSFTDLSVPYPQRRFILKSYTQNFCLDLENGETQDWVPMQVWGCNANTNNQKWDVGTVTLGPPTTQPINGLGKCLDVNQASNANGTQIQLYHCNSSNAQVWTAPGDGATGPLQALGKCLDLTSGSPGARAILWDCNGSATQQWFHSFSYEFVNPATNQCLDITGANSADFTPVELWTCNQTSAQRWSWFGETL